MMTGQPKPKGMVERGARSQLQIEFGHRGLETGLRNKSGKDVIPTYCGWANPAIFFFR